jgi:hypothetical protein
MDGQFLFSRASCPWSGREARHMLPYFGWDGGVQRPSRFNAKRLHHNCRELFLKAARKAEARGRSQMSNKTVRILLKAVAALAITAASGSASFAGKFTVHQGERYRAILALRSMERLVDNPLIAQKFRDLGFAGVKVSGAGATRRVEGVWPGKDTSANMPPQIVAVAKL